MWRAGLGVLCVLAAGCAAAAPRQPGVQAAPAAAAPIAIADKRAQFAQAYQEIAQQQYATAAARLQGLCPVYPELEDYCLYYLALSRLRSGDAAAADALWSRLATSYPQSLYAARADLERGRLHGAQGDADTARLLFAAAKTSEDDDVALQALLELAGLESAAGSLAAAHDDLMVARTRAPGTPLGRDAKRRIEELRQRDPALAPRDAALAQELRLLLRERDFTAARSAAETLLASASSAERPDLLRQRADAELGDGQFDLGLATLQEIVRRYPDSAAAPEAQFRYATLLWNRDRDQEAQLAYLDFQRRYPENAHMPEVLYALARIEQAEGHTDQAVAAYAQLADAYPGNSLAREARWRIGWMQYQAGRWRDAAATFERAAGAGAGAAPEADYWRARALERAGDRAAAERIYATLVEQAPASYYAYCAERRLGRTQAAPQAIAAAPQPPEIGPAPPLADPYHWVRANELRAAGLRPLARGELRAFERATADQPAAAGATIAAYQTVDGYRDAIRLGSARGLTDPAIFFPLAFWPQVSAHAQRDDVDPLLVLALMRQESMFDPAARSSADARGLMQLLPSTAERIAQRLGQPSPVGQLYDPDTNITLGVAHLQQLLNAYDGDQIKVLAAYNGGESAVAKWQQRFGGLEPDEFVESITYRETRDYVKRVMGNYQRYQREYRAP